jgi:hypothetical protein
MQFQQMICQCFLTSNDRRSQAGCASSAVCLALSQTRPYYSPALQRDSFDPNRQNSSNEGR